MSRRRQAAPSYAEALLAHRQFVDLIDELLASGGLGLGPAVDRWWGVQAEVPRFPGSLPSSLVAVADAAGTIGWLAFPMDGLDREMQLMAWRGGELSPLPSAFGKMPEGLAAEVGRELREAFGAGAGSRRVECRDLTVGPDTRLLDIDQDDLREVAPYRGRSHFPRWGSSSESAGMKPGWYLEHRGWRGSAQSA